jgi:hypothetical protein
MQGLIPDAREQWVAYLHFHCHLSPSDIFCVAPHQFRDVQEIGHVRRQILQRILLHSDLIREPFSLARPALTGVGYPYGT